VGRRSRLAYVIGHPLLFTVGCCIWCSQAPGTHRRELGAHRVRSLDAGGSVGVALFCDACWIGWYEVLPAVPAEMVESVFAR